MKIFLLVIFALMFAGSGEGSATPSVSSNARVIDVINNPAFEGFGRFLFPTERGMPSAEMQLDGIGSLLPFHSNINAETTIKVIQYMLNEANSGKTIFYDIYTDEEKQSDPTKEKFRPFLFPR